MIDIPALLLCDTYKTCHPKMYPKGLQKLVSYWVPRKSMLKSQNKMVFFGLQEFIVKYLVDYFEKNFFKKDWKDVKEEYVSILNHHLLGDRDNKGGADVPYILDTLEELHSLGFLPIRISAIPEGSLVNMGIPCIELTNTDERYPWLVQWIECILQTELWKICNHATIGYIYGKVAKKWYQMTVAAENENNWRNSMSDFGMRGMSCMEEGTRCSSAWLLTFNKTSTVPALKYIERYYNGCSESIGRGAVSTEHSVVSSNFGAGITEKQFLIRLLTETYPNTSFSFVSDTYDYWKFVKEDLANTNVKKAILKHNGTLLIRPDSGDIVDVSVKTVQSLWETFGGTENEKGYKVLDSHIRVIYGDGCTVEKVDKIWEQLESLGFAADNIYFGVGAFCFTAFFDSDDTIVVNTRDVFGIAAKATWAKINGVGVPIFKDPKTDTGNLKKSHKGCCSVMRIPEGYVCYDGYDWGTYDTVLHPVYENGFVLSNCDFEEIRERLANNAADEE